MMVARAWRFVLIAACLHASPAPVTRGRVLDAVTGRGIPGVRVSAISSEPAVWLHTTTDANGDYQFPRVTGGWQGCELEGYKRLSENEIAGADGSRPASYDSGNGRVSTPILILMIREEDLSRLSNTEALLSGSVLDETNRAIGGAAVVVYENLPPEAAREHPRNVQTDAQGRFSLKVHSGEIELIVTDPRYRNKCGAFPGIPEQKRAPLTHTVRLTPGERAELRLVLKPVPTQTVTGTIRNQVTPYNGGIILQLERELKSSNHRPQAYPDFAISAGEAGGAFSFPDVPFGRYLLRATLSKRTGDCDYCSNEPVYQVVQDIEVPTHGPRPITIDFLTGAEVTGPIRWEKKRSTYFDPSSLCLVNWAGIGYCNDSKDPQSLHMTRVQPGEYRVIAGIPQGEFQGYSAPGNHNFYLKEARLNGMLLSSRKVIIGADAKQAALDLYLSGSFAHCVAQVVDSEHHPLSLYTVVLMQRQGSHYVVRAVDPRLPEQYSFEPGQYLLVALTPALPRVALRPELFEQYANRAVPVTLTGGEALGLEVVAIEDHPLARSSADSGRIR
jgi:hypothetical protein